MTEQKIVSAQAVADAARAEEITRLQAAVDEAKITRDTAYVLCDAAERSHNEMANGPSLRYLATSAVAFDTAYVNALLKLRQAKRT